MILQALNQYYERLKDDPRVDIPLLGFGTRKVHCALVLSPEGRLVGIEDIRTGTGHKRAPVSLTVPVIGKKRCVSIEPNFMWDNTGYVLGIDAKGKDERSLRCFEAFRKLHHALGDTVGGCGMTAVLRFLDSWDPEDTAATDRLGGIAGANVVFRLDGEPVYIHEHPAVRDAWIRHCAGESSEVVATCLVSGKTRPIARLHQAIRGVQGAHSSGAGMVSFNLEAFLSYDKRQNFNAPVCEDIAFGYTTALNYLLRFGSRQKVRIGDAATVFWAEGRSPVEDLMRAILDPKDGPGDTAGVRAFLEAVRDGGRPPRIGDPDLRFFILGISPNASRLSVRFWHVSTVADVVSKIGQHFRDLSIVRGRKDPEFPGLWQLLRETAVQGKTDNIPPLLAGALMRSVLTGAAYPESLLSALVGRIRADQTINYLRAAMIKAILNRKHRIHNSAEEVSMSLDSASPNIAYRLGRLLAVLKKAQKDADQGTSAAVSDRYYGAASVAPSVVFPHLLRLAQGHFEKTEYGGLTDRMVEDIMEGIKEFPAHLDLIDQGMFAIGYYHQRQAFHAGSESMREEQPYGRRSHQESL